MFLINDKPYLDLGVYVDYNEFKALFPEIIAGIARTRYNNTWINGGYFVWPQHPNGSFQRNNIGFKHAYDNFKKDESVPSDGRAKQLEKEKSSSLSSYNVFCDYLRSKYRVWCPITAFHLLPTPFYTESVCSDISDYNLLNRQHFPKLLEWIETRLLGNVFEEIEVITIAIVDQDGVPYEHQDGYNRVNPVRSSCDLPQIQFMHMRDTRRGFYLFNPDTLDKIFIEPWACVFNTDDWHSTYRTIYPSWSLRVDGKYTDKIKKDFGWNT